MSVFKGNRYELLYVDDEAYDPEQNLLKKKSRQRKRKNIKTKARKTMNYDGNKTAEVDTNEKVNVESDKNVLSGTVEEIENTSTSAMPNPSPDTWVEGGLLNDDGEQKECDVILLKDENVDQLNHNKQQQRQGKDIQKNYSSRQFQQHNNYRNRDGNGIFPIGNIQYNRQPLRQYGYHIGYRRNFGAVSRNQSNNEARDKRVFSYQFNFNKTRFKAIDKCNSAGAQNWRSLQENVEDLKKPNDENVKESESLFDDKHTEQIMQIEKELQNELNANDIDKTNNTIMENTVQAQQKIKNLTLDEWKALRAVKIKQPQYNIRKAGEGEDLSQWEKMIALNTKKKEGENKEKLEYKNLSVYPQRAGRLQKLHIEIYFNNDQRSIDFKRKYRRGRDRSADAKQKRFSEIFGQFKCDLCRKLKEEQNAPKIEDINDFPTLG